MRKCSVRDERAEQALCASSEQFRNLAAHLLSVREEERARISREVAQGAMNVEDSFAFFKAARGWPAQYETGPASIQ
jgi:hypothetical protein